MLASNQDMDPASQGEMPGYRRALYCVCIVQYGVGHGDADGAHLEDLALADVEEEENRDLGDIHDGRAVWQISLTK